MRTVKFKNPGDSINVGGQHFNAGNMTPERYDALLTIEPKLADHFDVGDSEDEKPADEEKPAATKRLKLSEKPAE